MEAFGRLWKPLGAFGCLSESLEDFESFHKPSEVFGSLWKPSVALRLANAAYELSVIGLRFSLQKCLLPSLPSLPSLPYPYAITRTQLCRAKLS